MRFVPRKKIAAAGTLAAAACALVLANFAPSSVSAQRAGVLVGAAAISPLPMMMQAQLDLPAPRYATH